MNEKIMEAVEKVSKSVVTISTITHMQNFFFRTVPEYGMGSGVIMDENGYILTAHSRWC